MSIHPHIGGESKTLALCKVKVGGEWKEVAAISVHVAGDWKLAYTSGSPPVPPTPPGPAFAVSISPKTVTGSRSGAGSVTSGTATGTVANNDGSPTYAWSRVSGAILTITNDNLAATTFSATLTNGETKSAVYKLVATDSDSDVAEDTVTINLVSSYVAPPPPNPPALSGNVSPSTVSGSRSGAGSATSGVASASASGGSGSYSYSWSGGGCTPNSPSSASTTFSYTLTNGQTASFTGSCTISDTGGNSIVRNVTINFTSTHVTPPLDAYASPASVQKDEFIPEFGTVVSGSVSIVASGGSGNYSYSWSPAYIGTPPNAGTIQPNNLNSANNTFSSYLVPVTPSTSGTFYCTITDTVTLAQKVVSVYVRFN